MNTIFGENIGNVMDVKGITQERLHEISCISRQTINKAVQISPNNNYCISQVKSEPLRN